MISYIEGKILNQTQEDRYDTVEVLTSQGIGYEVLVPKQSIEIAINEPVSLFVSHIIREDSQSLYGFKSRDEKKLFNLLITVSSIGPKSAIAIMSKFTSSQLTKLISQEDFKTISTVPGLGSKGSQKIILELKDKLDWIHVYEGKDERNIDSAVLADLRDAMKSLGYDGSQIKESIEIAKSRLSTQKYTVEELLKFILSGK